MKQDNWTWYERLQHGLIHYIDDRLMDWHEWLIEYACERNLWRTPEQRREERE